jgi:uncharacterized membrane protein
MKRNFLTGIVIVLPIAITIWLMSVLVKICTAPFTSIVKSLLDRLAIVESGFWIFSADQTLHSIATVTIVASLFALLYFIGLVSRLLYLHILVKGLERLIARIPLISTIYRACREITDILFAPRETSATRVVWTPVPTPSQALLGFATNVVPIKTFEGGKETYISVFTPGTPNPTNSFLLLCQEKSLISTDLSVEESLRWIVSCGSSEPANFLKATTSIAKKIV